MTEVQVEGRIDAKENEFEVRGRYVFEAERIAWHYARAVRNYTPTSAAMQAAHSSAVGTAVHLCRVWAA